MTRIAPFFLVIWNMIKLIDVSQMKLAERDYMKSTGIESAELIEAAAKAFCGIFCGLVPEKSKAILILCGTGNNGSDGLAIARLLQYSGYSDIEVAIVSTSRPGTDDFGLHLRRLGKTPVKVKYITEADHFIFTQPVVIDALLGSGINRPLEAELRTIVRNVNESPARIIAVDCPTGFRCEGRLDHNEVVMKASDVISFQRPKLNFFFPESSSALARFHVVDIGLQENFIESLPSYYHLIEPRDVGRVLKARPEFSHKGAYGHVLIYAGSKGKAGAALLAAEACVYSGAGLTSVAMPEADRLALHTRLPEAMFVDLDDHAGFEEKQYSVIAFGPGLGDKPRFIEAILASSTVPLVVDADGLNYLSIHQELLAKLPPRSILTPHMKEFDRLFGPSDNWFDRVQLARSEAGKRQLYIVLKNRYTFIILPDGRVLINPSGNPGMASGGMGDALTGIIASFIAQGYGEEDACMIACFIHGRAGDVVRSRGNAVVPASLLISSLPQILGELQWP